MDIRKPPVDETEQLMNLLEGLASLEEGPSDDEIRAELAAQGIDMDAWAAELQVKAEAQLRVEEAKRQERAGKRTKALIGGGIGLAIAAGVAGVVVRAVVMRGATAADPVADKPMPTHYRRSREIPKMRGPEQQPPPLADTAESPDAGPALLPGKR
jgi:hypothetical protein